jgi:hypothetical protein
MDVLNGLSPASPTTRERLTADEVARLLVSSALIVDDRRRRPLYFDGRFLAARDLVRDQAYFLARQADLSLDAGTGVVAGLQVSSPSVNTVVVAAGQGITGTGELVVLRTDLPIDLSNIPSMQQLDLSFGLSRIPHEPPRSRTGLFVLGLRAVEYTANPIAAYPTSVGGARSVEDGDIVEAAAVTLVPYADSATSTELNARRAQVARSIFVEGGSSGVPAGVLPLAMLAVERGQVRWIDQDLVRREVGAERTDVLGLGVAPRATREAFVQQYNRHLQDVLAQRTANGGNARFAATDYFAALPPVGRMPVGAIDPTTFTQTFFPPQVDVDLSIVPQDEVAALVEEALDMPPIDLQLSAADLVSTSVLVFVPLARSQFVQQASSLTDRPRPLRIAAPGLVAARSPIESLRILIPQRGIVSSLPPSSVLDAAWRGVLSQAADGLAWYVRRRNLNVRADQVGSAVPVPIIT